MMRRLAMMGLLVVAACGGVTRGEDAPPATCARVGDRCSVAPGKLGLCVDASIDGAASKLRCQSQH